MHEINLLNLAAARVALDKLAWSAGEAMLGDAPAPPNPMLQQRMQMRQPFSPSEVGMFSPGAQPMQASSPIGGALQGDPSAIRALTQRGAGIPMPPTSPPEAAPPEGYDPNWGQVPPDIAQTGHPYAGLDRDQANEFMDSGNQAFEPPYKPAPQFDTSAGPEGVAEHRGLPGGEPVAPYDPVNPYQHVISDTQRLIDQNKARLAAGGLSPAQTVTARRGIANAQARIGQYKQRAGWGEAELAQHARANSAGPGAAMAADQSAHQAMQPGGVMDWHQQQSNNVTSGRPQYAGVSPRPPGLGMPSPAGPPPRAIATTSSPTGAPPPSAAPQSPPASAIAEHMQKYPYLSRWRQGSPVADGSPQFAAEYPNLNRFNMMQREMPMPAPHPGMGMLAGQ